MPSGISSVPFAITGSCINSFARLIVLLSKDADNITAIDDNPNTIYPLKRRQALIIDLGKAYQLKGFTYLPEPNNPNNNPIMEYEFYVSKDGKKWGKPVSQGEFSNIVNSPVLQKKEFPEATGRFIKLEPRKIHNHARTTNIAEIGVITR